MLELTVQQKAKQMPTGLEIFNSGFGFVGSLIGLLCLVLLIGYLSMPREEYTADPMAARCETISLINTGALATPNAIVESFKDPRRDSTGQYFYINHIKNKAYSKYGILNTLIYVPVLLFEKWHYGKLEYFSANRVIELNILNLIFALVSAAYLFLIASKYTRMLPALITFVLTALYCTYWWNYLRAQTSEIYQTLFMLAFYYHFTRAFTSVAYRVNGLPQSLTRRHPFLAGTFLGLLILTKTAYVILFPVLCLTILFSLWIYFRSRPSPDSEQTRANLFQFTLWLFLPIMFTIIMVLAVNNYKYGSPFESGYGQWQQAGKPIFSGHIWTGICGMTLNKQGSIFLHFPILGFALFGYRRFFKMFPFDGFLFLTFGLILLLFHSKMLNWQGSVCYGPRYMLVILPLLSLPFIPVVECFMKNCRKWWAIGGSVVIAISLLYSLRLQLNVNALPFFTVMQLEGISQFYNPSATEYFTSHHLGTISGDIIAYKEGRPLQVFDEIARHSDLRGFIGFKTFLYHYTSTNYYFWPESKYVRVPIPREIMCREALIMNPNDARAYNNLAIVLNQEGRIEEAIAQYHEALRIDPNNVEANNNLASALLLQGQPDEAIDNMQRALKLDPSNASIQNNLAWILATTADVHFRDGSRALQLALAASRTGDGKNPEMLDTLAAAYAATGKFSDAMETAKRALELAETQSNFDLSARLRREIKVYAAHHSIEG